MVLPVFLFFYHFFQRKGAVFEIFYYTFALKK